MQNGKITELAVALLLTAILVPIGIGQIIGVNTSTWDTTSKTVWGLLPIIAIVGLILGFMYYLRNK